MMILPHPNGYNYNRYHNVPPPWLHYRLPANTMRRTEPRVPNRLFAPGMRTALPSGAVGDTDAALHDTIVTILL